jgi:uncharacterized protein (TIGR03083 family)
VVVDQRGLEGLDPYEILDDEYRRVDDWFGALSAEQWDAPSSCDGWSRRDVLAHLLWCERYWQALLEGGRSEFLARYGAKGMTTIDEVVAAGLSEVSDLTPQQLLADWREQGRHNRLGYRAADGGDLDSSIGPYPVSLWAFHIALEVAVHADDAHVPVEDFEMAARLGWLGAVCRFALTELKDDVAVDLVGGDYVVRQGDLTIELDEEQFVAGVTGRAGSRAVGAVEQDLLSLGY